MTVNSSVFEQEFIGTGIATEFPFTIETLDKEWIKARVDGVDVAVTVTLNQNSDGGTCLFDVAPSLDSAVLIYRDVPLSQLFDFPEYSPFPSRNVEDSIDKLTMLVAACARLVDGSYEFNGRLLIDNNESIIFKNNEGSESPFDEGVYRFTNDDSNQWLLEQSNGNGGWVFPTPVSPKGVISKGYSDEKDQILQNQIDALQSPETSVGSLVALTGMPAGSIDLGVFDRNLIPDNSNIKDAIAYLADSNADYGISFKSVSDMIQGILPTGATAEYRISNVLHTCEFNDIIKQTWIVKASITGDDFGLELLGGLFAVLVPSSGGVTPSDFGASRNQTDNSSEIQACFDYCKLNNVQCTGVGRYYVDETVTLETGFFSSSRMLIIPLASFAAGVPVDYEDLQRRVIILNSTNITVTGLLAFNEFRVPDLVGMDYAQFQIKSYRSGAQNFAINNLVHSFSITITEGRGTGTGDPNDETTKGLVAYAPNFQSEINALNISGGEWFGNIGGAIDIGDRDEIFDTALTAANFDFMGNGICISNNSTTDKGFISIDKVINVTVHAYFENQGSVESAMLVGGWFEGSVNGIQITGYARDFDYYVKCLGSVRALNMRNCWSRIIKKSSLYIVSDIYPYTFDQSNVQFGSNTEAPVVHTGARAGIDVQTADSLFKGCTIAPDGLYDGIATGQGDPIYPSRTERVSRGELIYENKILRYYKTINSSGGTITNNVCTLNILADARFFNGGDAVTITVNGADVETYILNVDYELGKIYVNAFGYSISTLIITQKTLVPFLQSRSFEVPQTAVGYQDGSVVWNIGTVSASPDYWYLQQGVWVAGPSS